MLYCIGPALGPTSGPREGLGKRLHLVAAGEQSATPEWGHEAGQEDQDKDNPCGLIILIIIKKHITFGCVLKWSQPKPKI